MIHSGVAAADTVVLAREAIASISHRHGLVSTLLPKPLPNSGGSGAHLHLSMQATGSGATNLFSEFRDGLSADGSRAESFVAGEPLY